MGTITDKHGKVVGEFADTLEDWRQAARVEAGIRREFQEKYVALRKALEEIASHRIDSESASHEKRAMALRALAKHCTGP